MLSYIKLYYYAIALYLAMIIKADTFTQIENILKFVSCDYSTMSGHLTYKLKHLLNDSIYQFSPKVSCICYHIDFRGKKSRKNVFLQNVMLPILLFETTNTLPEICLKGDSLSLVAHTGGWLEGAADSSFLAEGRREYCPGPASVSLFPHHNLGCLFFFSLTSSCGCWENVLSWKSCELLLELKNLDNKLENKGNSKTKHQLLNNFQYHLSSLV